MGSAVEVSDPGAVAVVELRRRVRAVWKQELSLLRPGTDRLLGSTFETKS